MPVAMVTGAARGLGQAYCRALAGKGFAVAAVDIADLSETVSSAPGSHGFQADMTVPDEVYRVVREVEQALGGIDVLVNNVGGFPRIPFTEMRYEDWQRILRLNLDTAFLGCHAVVPGMIARRRGRIINIASGTVFKGNAGLSAYVAAKAGVIGLTRVLASELGAHGITVNCVAPGLTDTPGAREYTAGLQGEPDNIQRRAIKRRETPEDLTGIICFLASDEAAFITGQTIVVDGGNVKH